jgi:hypothetical protein
MKSSDKHQLKYANPVQWVSFWKSKENLLYLAAILIISFIVYLPSLQSGFVNWDDNIYVYKNPYITNISDWGSFFANAKVAFTTHVNNGYTPLVIISFAFEKMLYGLDSPEWWHLDNIILHLICVLLVFRLALALGLRLIPAAFCALLFGIHPMRVESVAWVTERKDLLYGSFYLIALYYYIKSVKISFRKRYFLIILTSFVLALFSKIQAVTLPLSMLLLDYYFGRKISIKLVYEKWLYFLLSLLTGIVGNYFLAVTGTLQKNALFPLFERIFIGSFSYIVYLIKSVVPYKMVPVYPYPETFGWIFYTSMIPALLILGSAYYFFLKKNKELVFGLLFFTFNVIFVLQIVGGGQAFIADRYTYIAYLGLFFIYAFGLQCALGKFGKLDKLIYITATLILGIFGYMNFEQNKIWKNDETLFSHILIYYPLSPEAYEYRANYYRDKGRLREALQDYTKAIQYSPESRKSKSLINRAVTYIELNMFDNALQDLSKVERLDPNNHLIRYYNALINIRINQQNQTTSD